MLKKIGILCLFAILLFGGMLAYKFWETDKNYRALTFHDVHMEEIMDGTYKGGCNLGLVEVEVQVTVQNHQIQNIELLHYAHGQGETAPDMLIKMQEMNRTDVDSISGATISCAAMRKAVENALLQQ